MDPVSGFVARALDVVTHLDYVAKCCQMCDRQFVDTLVGSELASFSVRREFDDLLPLLKRLGIEGAMPTSVVRSIQVDVDRAIDGLQLARDYRAWWHARPHVIDAIEWLHREAPPVSSVLPAVASPPPQPAPPGEARPAGNSTPSVHDIAGALTDNARCVLQALYEAKATCRADAMTKVDIGSAAGVEGKPLRRALVPLRDTVPPCIFSAPGAAGGVWLSSLGVDVALAIMEPSASSGSGTKGARKGHESGAMRSRTGHR